MNQYEPGKELVDDMINIILQIPKDTFKLTIEASFIGDDGESHTAHTVMKTNEVFEARKKFLDNLGDDDYDATYQLTDEGRAYLESLIDDRK